LLDNELLFKREFINLSCSPLKRKFIHPHTLQVRETPHFYPRP